MRCPDDGRCWHGCGDRMCWRVANCAPLSSYGDAWPDDIMAKARAVYPLVVDELWRYALQLAECDTLLDAYFHGLLVEQSPYPQHTEEDTST